MSAFVLSRRAASYWHVFWRYEIKFRRFKVPIRIYAGSEFCHHHFECWLKVDMMTSSNGNIFRVTGPLCGEFTGHRWITRTKASDAELWCFLWSAVEQTLKCKQPRRWWFETPSPSLWRHSNDTKLLHARGVLGGSHVTCVFSPSWNKQIAGTEHHRAERVLTKTFPDI